MSGNQLHDSNVRKLGKIDSCDETIPNAGEMEPTKENVLKVLDQFQQYHFQFKTEFSSRLTEIRRALLNISPTAFFDDTKSNGKSVVKNDGGKATSVQNKCADKANTVKLKPTTTALPGPYSIYSTVIFFSFKQ